MSGGKYFIQTIAAAALSATMAATPGAAQAPAANQHSPGSALVAPTDPAAIEAAKPNPQAPGFRVPLPTLDKMEPADRAEFLRGANAYFTPVGPRSALIITPEVGKAWSGLAAALQKSALTPDLFELTILMTAREWTTQFQWWVHELQAIDAGIPAEAVEAIRTDKTPTFVKPVQQAVYNYLRELLGPSHTVSDATYNRLSQLIGPKQVVELTVLAGHYTNVSMTIAAHGVPLRADVKPPLPPRKK